MITIKNLEFSYKDNRVLDNISLQLEEGRIYGLLGENGVGKTTLLTLLCGLKRVQNGSITIDGIEPSKRLPQSLADQYYLPDEVASMSITAKRYAKDFGKFWYKFDFQKFMKLMDIFENDPNKRMDKMSNGELKKAYISFALACNTKYLYLDEPTNGLDIPSKAQFRKAVSQFTREDSVLVISTHQVRDLENIIDPIIILDRRDVLLNASIDRIAEKLFFDYSGIPADNALYSELLPGSSIQVRPNTSNLESKVNVEALFNTVHLHKNYIKGLFDK
ncbi:MAG: ATP-binding cassette domain-containing protein [Bacteroidaceae bacterium]|nr:ATP-binding cassette domain-containing protein [Bacteroidaceae bacterium]